MIAANADLAAAEIRAQAKLVEAEADRKAALMQLEVEKARLTLLGEMYQTHPELIQLELAKLAAQAMSGVHVAVGTPEVFQQTLATTGSGIFQRAGLFSFPSDKQSVEFPKPAC